MGRGRQRDHLFGRCIDARIVFESGREPERARRQFVPQQRPHGFDLGLVCHAPEIVPHDPATKRAVAHVRRDVDRRRTLFQLIKKVGQREPGPPILPGDDGGDPLAHDGHGFRVLDETPVVMAVGVDEAGRQHHRRPPPVRPATTPAWPRFRPRLPYAENRPP